MDNSIRRRDFTIFALATFAGLLTETLTARSGQATGKRQHMPVRSRSYYRKEAASGTNAGDPDQWQEIADPRMGVIGDRPSDALVMDL